MTSRANTEALERLGRIVGALRQGAAIVLPYVDGARGSRWSETFVKGVWQGDGDTTLLHGVDHIDRQGREHKGRREPTDWDLDAMLEQSAHWDEETIAALPTLDAVTGDPAVQLILGLADGPRDIAAKRTWMAEDEGRTRIVTSGSAQWQLSDLVMAEFKDR